MSENWIPKETTTKYLIEGDNAQFRVQAEKALKIAKELEAKKETIPVWYDERTTKFVSLEKNKAQEAGDNKGEDRQGRAGLYGERYCKEKWIYNRIV